MEEDTKPKEYISVRAAGEILGRTVYTVYHYWRQGKLEGRQYGKGGKIEIDKASAERFLKKARRTKQPLPEHSGLTTEPADGEAMAAEPDAADRPSASLPPAGAVADPEEPAERRDVGTRG
jgi:hypothetical protein